MRLRKYILPVVAGTMGGMILQSFGEFGIKHLYPPPAEISLENRILLKQYFDSLPVAAFTLLVLNYALCSLVAGIASTIISGRRDINPALISGIIITLAGIFNAVMMPEQPLLFSLLCIISHLPMTLLGYRLSREK